MKPWKNSITTALLEITLNNVSPYWMWRERWVKNTERWTVIQILQLLHFGRKNHHRIRKIFLLQATHKTLSHFHLAAMTIGFLQSGWREDWLACWHKWSKASHLILQLKDREVSTIHGFNIHISHWIATAVCLRNNPELNYDLFLMWFSIISYRQYQRQHVLYV